MNKTSIDEYMAKLPDQEALDQFQQRMQIAKSSGPAAPDNGRIARDIVAAISTDVDYTPIDFGISRYIFIDGVRISHSLHARMLN
jgi:hypothetical protein